jgi:hypothetical protein
MKFNLIYFYVLFGTNVKRPSGCSAILLRLVASVLFSKARAVKIIVQFSKGLLALALQPNGPQAHDAPKFRSRRTSELHSHGSRDWSRQISKIHPCATISALRKHDTDLRQAGMSMSCDPHAKSNCPLTRS